MTLFKINYKYFAYITNISSTLIQFIVAYIASTLVPNELGINAIYTTIFGIFFKACQFEGQFLYISKEISYKNLLIASRSSASLLFSVQLICSLLLIFNGHYLALLFFSQGIISLYGYWITDLYHGKDRLKEDNNNEIKYYKAMNAQILYFSIFPSISTLLLLKSTDINSLLIYFYAFFLSLVGFYLILTKIKIYFSLKKILKYFPPKKYFFAPTLRRIDSSLITIILGTLLGTEILGKLQPIIKIGKATNLLTPLYLKLNFANLDLSFNPKKIFYLTFIKYLSFILLAFIAKFIIPLKQINIIDLSTIIYIFLFYGTSNIKSFLWAYFFKLNESIYAINQHLLFLSLKLIAFLILFLYIILISPIYINPIILAIGFPEFLIIMYANYKLYFKK